MPERRSLLLSATGLIAACLASPAGAQPVFIERAPPPPRVVEVPPPRRGFLWVPGYWRWNGRDHVWVEGRWERERRGYAYNAPRWEQEGPRWRWVPGGWVRH